eukprot:gnl/Trimastix_PCT/4858.p1 GENE.gnl/Trimastix_PCT/4858~~gnl/Trimastix_PCT/4858.p1  ORF type:complete len:338 (-),score=42.75 gnl/Trimastix_PCT/4858:7-972(-)
MAQGSLSPGPSEVAPVGAVPTSDDVPHTQQMKKNAPVAVAVAETEAEAEGERAGIPSRPSSPVAASKPKTHMEKRLGCPHYIRNCKMRCKQCGKFFTCRFCHDEWANETSFPHEFDRHDVDEMYCMLCERIGPVGKHCTHCFAEMARYYCDACHLFEGHPTKEVYHCDKCGICRVGQRGDYFHCDACGCCYTISSAKDHECFPRDYMVGPCPICLKDMFSSRAPCVPLACGHFVHRSCYISLVRKSIFTCPVCKKLFLRGEERKRWEHLRGVQIATTPVPEEYLEYRRQILCNECGHSFEARINFAGYQCTQCGSHNTRMT